MADSDIRDNTSETSKLNESLLSSIKATEDLKREIDTLNKQKVEPAQAQARLSATAGPTLSPAEEMRRAVQTAIRQSAQATVVRPPNPLPSRPTETARPPQAMSPTSTVVRPPQTTQSTSTTITTPQPSRVIPIEPPRRQEPSSNLSSPQRSQSKVEVLQATPKDSTRQEATPQRSNMGKGAASGWAWVGEHGKELVHFQGGETVLSHDKSVDKADKGLSSLPGYASGTPNPPPPPPGPHPLDPYIQRLSQAIDTLNTAKQAGMGGGTAAGKQLLKRARLQAAHLANRYARLTPKQQQAASPQLQQVSQRMKQVEDEEIERRRKLNNELTREQYAVAEFGANLARGDVGGAMGSLAGAAPGKWGIVAGIAAAIAQNIHGKFISEHEGVRRGGQELNPGLAQTEQVSTTLREMEQAKQYGELGRMQNRIAMEQMQRQALKLHMRPSENPESWLAHIPFAQYIGGRGARARAEGQSQYLATLARGGTTEEAETARLKSLTEYFSKLIKRKGGTPSPIAMDVPNLAEGGATTLEAYQMELQGGALQQQGATNEKLQEILQQLSELVGVSREISINTNGLQNNSPQWSGG